MTETTSDNLPDNPESGDTALEESADGFRMSLDVDVQDAGPCKKHVRVRVPRADIDHIHGDALDELAGSASVPGFRVGHVPRQLLEKRFKQELSSQVKQKVLIDSLEQIAEDNKLDPINEPKLDFESMEIPDEGDFEYEFDVEVRPEFDLPDYEGLTIKRPTRTVSEAEVDAYLQRYLGQYGQMVPHDGPAEAGDYVTVDIEFHHNGALLRRLSDEMIRVRPVLRFQDAELDNFETLIAGASAGDTREADLTISQEADQVEMRGETVHATIHIQEVKRHRMPELNREFLDRIEFESEEELRERVREMLDRQTVYQQRQAARGQVLEKITESADWDLPEELVRKQVENALRREVLEMQQAGFTTQDIRARENEIRQRSISTTRQALKEHFVLDKIATKENIEISVDDIEAEIRLMAMQRGENPRRVRARLIKTGMIENLEAQIRERKAIDFILGKAVYEDVELPAPVEDRIEAVSYAICGPTAVSSSTSDDADDETDE